MECLYKLYRRPAFNSIYTKGGVFCSTNSLLVNPTLVFQIKLSGNASTPFYRQQKTADMILIYHLSIISNLNIVAPPVNPPPL